jgi:hypothetical protein
MLDKTVVLGATRYRVHNGYATQVGGGANFYYSGLINSAPQTTSSRVLLSHKKVNSLRVTRSRWIFPRQ